MNPDERIEALMRRREKRRALEATAKERALARLKALEDRVWAAERLTAEWERYQREHHLSWDEMLDLLEAMGRIPRGDKKDPERDHYHPTLNQLREKLARARQRFQDTYGSPKFTPWYQLPRKGKYQDVKSGGKPVKPVTCEKCGCFPGPDRRCGCVG